MTYRHQIFSDLPTNAVAPVFSTRLVVSTKLNGDRQSSRTVDRTDHYPTRFVVKQHGSFRTSGLHRKFSLVSVVLADLDKQFLFLGEPHRINVFFDRGVFQVRGTASSYVQNGSAIR